MSSRWLDSWSNDGLAEAKTVVFKFFNCYSSLYYVAFFKDLQRLSACLVLGIKNRSPLVHHAASDRLPRRDEGLPCFDRECRS